jgi:hypothetical protein
MMHKPNDRRDSRPSQLLEPGVVPPPVGLAGNIARSLPKDGIAKRLYPQVGNQVDIFRPIAVTRVDYLVAKVVRNTNAGTFKAAPELEGFQSAHCAASMNPVLDFAALL